MNLPPEYTSSVRGRGAELERTFSEFIAAFIVSILLMYMILAAQFESLVHPLTILVALPLSVPFALFSLWATQNTLNVYSALVVLFGVVKKNSILQVDHMNHLRRNGMNRYDAILAANRDRSRPILMTTLALVAGMIPLWVGTGPGSEERRTIAVVVIGGQTLSLALTLIMNDEASSETSSMMVVDLVNVLEAEIADVSARAAQRAEALEAVGAEAFEAAGVLPQDASASDLVRRAHQVRSLVPYASGVLAELQSDAGRMLVLAKLRRTLEESAPQDRPKSS
jgi:hydrophobic/amphiphilic exporter-1 (mainly G- bacteria), HAE1 family